VSIVVGSVLATPRLAQAATGDILEYPVLTAGSSPGAITAGPVGNDTDTGATVGTPDIESVQPNAFWGIYQPKGGLPSGHRASAVVTTTGGAVAVICNESSSSSFVSYTGQ
jgi:hypothetical protein